MDVKTVITICFYLLVLWYAIFLAGTFQFRSLKKKTELLVIDKAKTMAGAGPATSEDIFNAVYPEWCEMVRKSACFIPSKSELRPIPASIHNVEMRLKFSPQWVKTYLEKQGLTNLE